MNGAHRGQIRAAAAYCEFTLGYETPQCPPGSPCLKLLGLENSREGVGGLWRGPADLAEGDKVKAEEQEQNSG